MLFKIKNNVVFILFNVPARKNESRIVAEKKSLK